MVKMTQSFSHWLLSNYPEKYSLILFGHLELLTEEMKNEYAEWVVTDEGKSYLNVESQRPAEWEYTDGRWGLGDWRCSKCGGYSNKDTHYCPNCGRRMKK